MADLDARSAVRVLLRSGDSELGEALGDLVAGLAHRSYRLDALLAQAIVHVPAEGLASALAQLHDDARLRGAITALPPDSSLSRAIGTLIDQLATARMQGLLVEQQHAIEEAMGQCREGCPGWGGQVSCELVRGHDGVHRGTPHGSSNVVTWPPDPRESYWRARRAEEGLWER